MGIVVEQQKSPGLVLAVWDSIGAIHLGMHSRLKSQLVENETENRRSKKMCEQILDGADPQERECNC